MTHDRWPSPFGSMPSSLPDSDGVMETILSHVSVREFIPADIPNDVIALLCEAMRRAPSSSALQTRTFVIVTDPAVRAALRPHAGGQACVASCSAFIVGCADFRLVDAAVREREYLDRSGDLRLLITATEDVAVAQQNASLTAQSLGWGTVMIGGVLNGASEIARLLKLPPRIIPLLGLCVGQPVEPEQPTRPRLPRPVMFHQNCFDLTAEAEAALLAEHDREIIERGYYDGRRIPWTEIGGDSLDPVIDEAYGWSEHVARKQARLWWEQATAGLLADLRQLGWRE